MFASEATKTSSFTFTQDQLGQRAAVGGQFGEQTLRVGECRKPSCSDSRCHTQLSSPDAIL